MDKQQTEDLKKKLTPEQYNICFLKGTEPPFSGKYTDNKEKGMYNCVVCGNPLFSSKTKFDTKVAGLSGWPSFDAAIPESVKFETDESLGMTRTEALCAKCGSHLGHMFEEKTETKTGKHYCINSLALEFVPEKN